MEENTNDFSAIGNKEKLSETTEINSDNIYHLHLADMVPNVYDAYLELGKSNWKLKGKLNDQKLNDLANKLNVTVNLTNPTLKSQAMDWLLNYQDFIKNNKDQWINDIINVTSRGFASDQQIQNIKDPINSLKFSDYLQKILCSPNVSAGLGISDDYLKFIKLDKLQADIIDWINQNIPEINQTYHNAINKAESHLSLHGSSFNQILDHNTKPKTKDEINNFADGKSYHNWLQYQADKKFHGWQLQMGLGIGIPLLAINPVIIGVLISLRTKSKNNPPAKKWQKI